MNGWHPDSDALALDAELLRDELDSCAHEIGVLRKLVHRLAAALAGHDVEAALGSYEKWKARQL